MTFCLIVVFTLIGSNSDAYSKSSEKRRLLQLCSHEFGSPVDRNRNLFDINEAFALEVRFGRNGLLSEFAIKPKYFFSDTHPEWEEPSSFPLLSPAQFEDIVNRLEGLKTKGPLVRRANSTAFVTNSTAYFKETYERAVLEWGEVGIRGQVENGIRFFTVRYLAPCHRPR